ncbi:hypothetical protein F4802DRAFT_451037 [Xylaria palmicola]|nr:hypothetical protein F4802DRAFT_451037 [Xylaria palmicola]
MTAPTANMSSAKTTVEDFGLVRESTVWEPKDTAFIDSYLACSSPDPNPATPTPEWSSFKITLPRESRSPKLVNGYAVSASHHAYVTFCVQLTAQDDASRRLTAMRYRDMIADNYASACGSPAALSQLRWLGVANILDASSRAMFACVFERAGRDMLARGSVEICPDEVFRRRHDEDDEAARPLRAHLLGGKFTRGVLALLHHHARHIGAGAFVRRFIFLSEGYDGPRHPTNGPSPIELRLNLVVGLARRDDLGAAVNAENPCANL